MTRTSSIPVHSVIRASKSKAIVKALSQSSLDYYALECSASWYEFLCGKASAPDWAKLFPLFELVLDADLQALFGKCDGVIPQPYGADRRVYVFEEGAHYFFLGAEKNHYVTPLIFSPKSLLGISTGQRIRVQERFLDPHPLMVDLSRFSVSLARQLDLHIPSFHKNLRNKVPHLYDQFQSEQEAMTLMACLSDTPRAEILNVTHQGSTSLLPVIEALPMVPPTRKRVLKA